MKDDHLDIPLYAEIVCYHHFEWRQCILTSLYKETKNLTSLDMETDYLDIADHG